jgi:hypothetical protein
LDLIGFSVKLLSDYDIFNENMFGHFGQSHVSLGNSINIFKGKKLKTKNKQMWISGKCYQYFIMAFHLELMKLFIYTWNFHMIT